MVGVANGATQCRVVEKYSVKVSAVRRNRLSPAGFPAGPKGEIPFFSERDLVVAVDQLGVFVLGRLRAAQEVDLLGDDLAPTKMARRSEALTEVSVSMRRMA